MIKFETLSFR